MPWADPGSAFTRDFEDTVGLLAQRMDKTGVCGLMGIAWQTVGSVAARVFRRRGPRDSLDRLRRIGIDEISYKRGHHYLTVVTDHDRKRVVWVGIGRKEATVDAFFNALGEHRTSQIQLVSIDMADSYIEAGHRGRRSYSTAFTSSDSLTMRSTRCAVPKSGLKWEALRRR